MSGRIGIVVQRPGSVAGSRSRFPGGDAHLGSYPGKANAEYAWNLNNLGMLYYDLGQYAKAEGLYQESRSIREATLGRSIRSMPAA